MSSILKNILKITPFVITLILFFLFGYQIINAEETFIEIFINNFGYLAVAFLAFFSSFVFALPIPAGIWINYYFQAELSFGVVLLVLTTFQTLADITSILFASVIFTEYYKRNSKIQLNVKKFKEKMGSIPLLTFFFWVIFVPLPNEIASYALISIGYKLKKIIPILIVGNTIFNLLITSGVLILF